tara:strand:+ start:2760 stop:3410 length:651 start_codon:yes stop_codon:yes gene_type:complete
MNLSNYYYAFDSALPLRFCDDVIKYSLAQKMAKGMVPIKGTPTTDQHGKKTLGKDEKFRLKQIRNSDIVWLKENWVYRHVHPFIKEANEKAGWNFNLKRSEPVQFTQYKPGQYYDWHCDAHTTVYDDGHYKGMGRKLSVTCQLTDSSEYEGGELEFDYRNYSPNKRDELTHVIKAKQILKKGSIVVFPSFVWHRVRPVTKGTRYSLVVWNLGYPFT